ncbi:hypothetical protein [Dactylosporangium sp. NPDC005555]|uniref:hypothetical protein n=1 Tax=Dactylosporangium sp. NPDC005555 TaxID=3154889 RepID=UPI0033BF3CAA
MVAIHSTGRGAATPADAAGRSLTQATFAALNAPSVGETQPWRWRVDRDRIGLFADWDRQLADVDPDGRLLLISCGAALHHARVALAAEGVGVEVRRFPDPGDPALLTELRCTGPIERLPEAGALHRAIAVRRSDRRPFTTQPPSDRQLAPLMAAAEQAGAGSYTLTGSDVLGSSPAGAAYVVITTPGAAAGDWVTAGEAVSAVLLSATTAGLASSPVDDVTALTQGVHRAPHAAAAVRVGVAGRVGAPWRPEPEESP